MILYLSSHILSSSKLSHIIARLSVWIFVLTMQIFVAFCDSFCLYIIISQTRNILLRVGSAKLLHIQKHIFFPKAIHLHDLWYTYFSIKIKLSSETTKRTELKECNTSHFWPKAFSSSRRLKNNFFYSQS